MCEGDPVSGGITGSDEGRAGLVTCSKLLNRSAITLAGEERCPRRILSVFAWRVSTWCQSSSFPLRVVGLLKRLNFLASRPRRLVRLSLRVGLGWAEYGLPARRPLESGLEGEGVRLGLAGRDKDCGAAVLDSKSRLSSKVSSTGLRNLVNFNGSVGGI